MAVYKNIMMKHIEIKTGKATLVVVENAETIFKGISIWDNIIFNKNVFPLLPDELHNEDDIYEIIGTPNDLYEEDWKGIVDLHFMDGHRSYPLYRDYRIDENSAIWLDSATESGLSLLKANGVVMENPRGDQPHNTGLVHLYPTGNPIGDIALKVAIDWLEAQEQVWVNPHVFIKID